MAKAKKKAAQKSTEKPARAQYVPNSTLIIRFDNEDEIKEFKALKEVLAPKFVPEGKRVSWSLIAKAAIRAAA